MQRQTDQEFAISFRGHSFDLCDPDMIRAIITKQKILRYSKSTLLVERTSQI